MSQHTSTSQVLTGCMSQCRDVEKILIFLMTNLGERKIEILQLQNYQNGIFLDKKKKPKMLH